MLIFILWGSQIPCLKILSEELPPLPLNTFRFSLATLALLPFALFQRTIPRQRDLLGMAGLGWLNITLYGLLAINGLQRTTAVNGTVLLNTHPLITALLSPLLLNETRIRKKAAGLGLGFVGMVVVVNGGLDMRALLHHHALFGNLLVLGAACCLALYAILSKRYVTRYSGVTTVFFVLLSGTIALILLTLLQGEWSLSGVLSVKILLLLGYVAIVTTSLAWVVWFEAIKRIGVIHTSSFFFILPVSGIGFSALFLDEPLTLSVVIGTGCILAGITIVQKV